MRTYGFAFCALLGAGLVTESGAVSADVVWEPESFWQGSNELDAEFAVGGAVAEPYVFSPAQYRTGRYHRYPDRHYSQWRYHRRPRYYTWHRYRSPSIWRYNIYGFDGRYYGRYPYERSGRYPYSRYPYWRRDDYRDRGFYFGFRW